MSTKARGTAPTPTGVAPVSITHRAGASVTGATIPTPVTRRPGGIPLGTRYGETGTTTTTTTTTTGDVKDACTPVRYPVTEFEQQILDIMNRLFPAKNESGASIPFTLLSVSQLLLGIYEKTRYLDPLNRAREQKLEPHRAMTLKLFRFILEERGYRADNRVSAEGDTQRGAVMVFTANAEAMLDHNMKIAGGCWSIPVIVADSGIREDSATKSGFFGRLCNAKQPTDA